MWVDVGKGSWHGVRRVRTVCQTFPGSQTKANAGPGMGREECERHTSTALGIVSEKRRSHSRRTKNESTAAPNVSKQGATHKVAHMG